MIDVQCCMPSLPKVAQAYHTQIVSTSAIARTTAAAQQHFDHDHAFEGAKNLLKQAIDNYRHRDPAKVMIPDVFLATDRGVQRGGDQVHARRQIPCFVPAAQ